VPIGARVGSRIGASISVAVGVDKDGICGGGSMAGVAQDATSLVYCPASASQWSTALAAAGLSVGPISLYLLQMASGNAADSIGSNTLTAAGVITYQAVVAGWSRVAVSYADASAANFTNSTTAPDAGASSLLWLAYQYVSGTPAANRQSLRLGGTTVGSSNETTAGKYQALFGAQSTTGFASPFTGAVRPVVLKHDLTNSKAVLYTNQEKLVPTYAALAGIKVGIGAGALGTPAGGTLYAALFSGTGAEQFTDAKTKTLLQALNWTVSGW
jgi:hypothetical protein